MFQQRPYFYALCVSILCLSILLLSGCKDRKIENDNSVSKDFAVFCSVLKPDTETAKAISIAPVDKKLEFWAAGVSDELRSSEVKAFFEVLSDVDEDDRCDAIHAAAQKLGIQWSSCVQLCRAEGRYGYEMVRELDVPASTSNESPPLWTAFDATQESDPEYLKKAKLQTEMALRVEQGVVHIRGQKSAIKTADEQGALPALVGAIRGSAATHANLLVAREVPFAELRRVIASLDEAGGGQKKQFVLGGIRDTLKLSGSKAGLGGLGKDEVLLPFETEPLKSQTFLRVGLTSSGVMLFIVEGGHASPLPPIKGCLPDGPTICGEHSSETSELWWRLYNKVVELKTTHAALGAMTKFEVTVADDVPFHTLIRLADTLRHARGPRDDDRALIAPFTSAKAFYSSETIGERHQSPTPLFSDLHLAF